MYDPEQFSKLRFQEAGEQYLAARRGTLKPRTHYGYEHHVKHLSVFFGEMRLHQIHVGHMMAYQKARRDNDGGTWFTPGNDPGHAQSNERATPWPHKAKASLINHELSTMQSILKRANEWEKIRPHYEPLPTPPPSKPKVLSDTEEMKLFQIAAQNQEWELAYWVASITCNTGASGTELRNIQLHDLHLGGRIPFFTINPETAKHQVRGRDVALNPTALKQVERCLERARALGSVQQDHYLFPKRIRGTNRYDPAKATSASWLRRQWEALRAAAGMPWLTPHCFRHQHITLRIEAEESIELIAKDVGHSATAMTRYYTHSRRERQQVSVNKIDPSVRFGRSLARGRR